MRINNSMLTCAVGLILLIVSNVLSYRLSRYGFKRKIDRNINNRLHSNLINSENIDCNVNVAILGSGIAGSTISWLLQEQYNLSVALIDPRVNEKGTWYPNYGEWRDEWHHLSNELKLPDLKKCTTNEWEITDCFFGGSYNISSEERLTLPRPYIRVDRIKMQELLYSRFINSGGIAIPSKLSIQRQSNNIFTNFPSNKNDFNPIINLPDSTLIQLDGKQTIKCDVLIDSTGLESRIISRESSQYARGHSKEYSIGYQIAYGFIAHVNSLGPYDNKAMTLFDYRTDHYKNNKRLKEISDMPTFMYVMPLGELPNGDYRVFFEETSLVGRDERRLSFEECKKRAFDRLKYHKIKIKGIEEEEYCYIPMGGELPDQTQRIIAFGGAANMVHPSTGYQACRMLASARGLANTIAKGIKSKQSPDVISKFAYKNMWSKANRLQRDFQAFGGDFLMEQNVDILRGFFLAFFSLNQPVWSGFLAGYPGLPNNEYHETWFKRLIFAISLFLKMPWIVRLTMIFFAITHTIQYGPNTLLRSLTPSFLFGDGPKEEDILLDNIIGDNDAKNEAKLMMSKFIPSAKKPSNTSNEIENEEKKKEKLILPSPFNN